MAKDELKNQLGHPLPGTPQEVTDGGLMTRYVRQRDEAAFEGLLRARGDYVYIIDCDLEEQPEWLADFWATIKADPGKDLV